MRVGMSRHVDEPIRPPLGINQASLGQTFPLLEFVLWVSAVLKGAHKRKIKSMATAASTAHLE